MAIKRPEYILAIDQGTTGTRAVIFNKNARRVAATSIAMDPINPHSGWVEQAPIDIWRTTQTAITETMIEAGIRADAIKAIGIASQRETTIIWDKKTGQPIYNAIVWSSTQSQAIADQILQAGHTEMIREKTGLPLSAYFSATKIRWILDHVPGAQAEAERGNLLFGTVDSWLIWNLTDHQAHLTDISNAARTMLFNIHTQAWDDELLSLFNIPKSMLPTVTRSNGQIATTNPMQFFGSEIPITAVIGDQNAGLIGQLGFNPGTVKSTYGSGAFLLLNTGHHLIDSQHDLASTIAYQIDDQPVYALEGSVFTAGSAIQWLNEQLNLIDEVTDSWEAAQQATSDDSLYVVPAFLGLGAPYWDPQARGAVFGITRTTNRNDFIKATLQSIAYQTADILRTMKADTGHQIDVLKADGSVSRNPYLMQFQSDITGLTIERSVYEDTTPLGAAFLAGLAVGYWESLDDLATLTSQGRTFQPTMSVEKRLQLKKGWQRAIDATRFFANENA
ncbi:glycerol kinase GlpK [Weissella diestrammenae]|uniref:glycerol kinase n=1 Tax=Weissella diestrammenae TaxID=1162633 RepID=A0A7G9T6P6_9LACO|nr:glycerol kinase GlpK [Weissella diestrammenae]MCM0582943.1 glycerol kinase GlpK [Weissella diestrammenae]QNN75771.1 glycerol kinase GlpK [Weissella diestrammenae]